jgi:hypothetical protein
MEKRIRSPNYPALSLPDAIEKVAGIYRSVHTHAGPREVIAKAMGYAGLNGASATAISALRKYGLLEKAGEEVKVSERALRILHPHSPAEKVQAVREAAGDPVLFSELTERFSGKAPNEDLLRNYLVRRGFAPGALTAVISAYRETSDMVARESEGHDSGPDHKEEPAPMSQTSLSPATTGTIQPSPAIQAVANERPIGRYDFEGGAYVRIAAFGDIDTEEALDMVETLIQLKRKELERANKRANSERQDVVSAPENGQAIS